MVARNHLEDIRLSASEKHQQALPARDSDPVDLLLAAYSSGDLDPALHALVASHLLMAPRNRRYVAALDELAGGELEAIAPLALPNRDACLEAIFSAQPRTASRPAPRIAAGESEIVLPEPLRAYLGSDLSALRWKSLLPGVREAVIERKGRGDAKVLWTKGGRRMPRHTHEGSEITLIVQGAFRDKTGLYRTGDIVIAESDLDHQPVTEAGVDCICFAVTDAPIHLTGPVGRIMERFFPQ